MKGYIGYIKEYYKEIKENYNFEFVIIKESSVALVGEGFAITINVNIDNVIFTYISKGEDGEFYEYWFDSYITKAVDNKDKEGIPDNDTIHENILEIMQIKANILKNHWQNILKGDKKWIKDYLKDKNNKVYKADEHNIKILKSYFDK